MTATIVWVLIALLPTALLLPRHLRARADRRQRNVFSRWPIPSVPLDEIDPVFHTGPLGPSLDAEVQFVGGVGAVRVPGATSDTEAWVLSVLCKQAQLMFEFGTCTGRTAYLWARNSPPDARVVTITLRSQDHERYRRADGDAATDVQHALEESAFEQFLYSGTPVEAKVQQLFGDSKALDDTPWHEQCDLVFVDAHRFVRRERFSQGRAHGAAGRACAVARLSWCTRRARCLRGAQCPRHAASAAAHRRHVVCGVPSSTGVNQHRAPRGHAQRWHFPQ
jgi:hypothetical protein